VDYSAAMDGKAVRRLDAAIIGCVGLLQLTYRHAGSAFLFLTSATLFSLCAWRLWATRKRPKA
jgi:hypothetical protein